MFHAGTIYKFVKRILVKRSTYLPFGDKGSMVRLFCKCNDSVSQNARVTKLNGYFAPRLKRKDKKSDQ